MKIKLWKENLKAKEYEMEVSKIIEGFKSSLYEEYQNVYRWLPVYISFDLNSSFDTTKYQLLLDEYFKQKELKEK